MAAEEGTEFEVPIERVMDEIRRELILRVARMDRDEHRDIYDALENE